MITRNLRYWQCSGRGVEVIAEYGCSVKGTYLVLSNLVVPFDDLFRKKKRKEGDRFWESRWIVESE